MLLAARALVPATAGDTLLPLDARWRVELPVAAVAPPARDDERVYVPLGDGTLASFAVDDGRKDWTASLAPAFEIEGRALEPFLEHLCRERGWTLQYADAALAREASGIILHGSVDGLQPADALAVVFAASGLTHRFQRGELVVSRASDAGLD